MKICTKCTVEQPLTEFTKTNRTKSGLYNKCKSCQKEYRKENIDKIKKYRDANSDSKKEYMKIWKNENRDRQLAYFKRTYLEKREQKLQYFRDNKDVREAKRKEYVKNNPEIVKNYKRDKKRINEKSKEYNKVKRKTCPLFKLKSNIRTRMWFIFSNKGFKKGSKSHIILGADYPVVMKHIQRQFKKGMTWDNYGQWHIDHKLPLAYAKTEDELISLCHYTNLQPLWATDNWKKNRFIVEHQIKLTI